MISSLSHQQRSFFTDSHIVTPYNSTRPDIYKVATQKILRFLFDLDITPTDILDVGCGTGRSTLALASISRSVIGVEPSLQMLDNHNHHPHIEFRQGAAEALPVERMFDLVVASMSFEYFKPSQFFDELDRVLKRDGIFATYTCQFGGNCTNAELREWLIGDLFARYPEKVSRQGIQKCLAELPTNTFQVVGQCPYEIVEAYDVNRFADYILTKSNFSGLDSSTIAELKQEIVSRVHQFWAQPTQLVKFNGAISFVARTANTRIVPGRLLGLRNRLRRLKVQVQRHH
ncbi:MAG: class I SAM-dependent methyltransferase [Cyanobacteria bacterium P01_A01_bin.3]